MNDNLTITTTEETYKRAEDGKAVLVDKKEVKREGVEAPAQAPQAL